MNNRHSVSSQEATISTTISLSLSPPSSLSMGNRILALLLISLFCSCSKGLQHIVGDSIWSIPPTNDFYTNWSSTYTFHTDDTLYFDFDSGFYNVIQVSRGEFDGCSGDHAYNTLMDGPAILPLPREGVFYFICNVSNYCALGQKLCVIVEQKPA